MSDKRTFTVQGVEYAVVEPTNEIQMGADEERRKVFNQSFLEALCSGNSLRENLERGNFGMIKGKWNMIL